MKNKINEYTELTKKDLVALCKKQGEHIEELENKIKSNVLIPKGTEKLEVVKPDYDELRREILNSNEKICKLKQENDALRYSLTRMYIQLEGSQAREEMWEEDYYKADKRANELFDELERKKYDK